MSDKSTNRKIHHLSGFFLVVTIFVITVSILAVFTTILAVEYSIMKDDIQISSLVHLTKSMDWFNDYNEEKIGERLLKAQIDNLNLSLQISSNNSINISQFIQNINNYKSHLNLLEADEKTAGSLLSYRIMQKRKIMNSFKHLRIFLMSQKSLDYTNLLLYS